MGSDVAVSVRKAQQPQSSPYTMKNTITPALLQLCRLLIGQKTPQAIAANEWENIVYQAQKHEMQPLLAWRIKQYQFALQANFQQQLTLNTQQSAARYAL